MSGSRGDERVHFQGSVVLQADSLQASRETTLKEQPRYPSPELFMAKVSREPIGRNTHPSLMLCPLVMPPRPGQAAKGANSSVGTS